MATVKVFGPYTYYTSNWTPGTYWYPIWGPWPDSGNGTVIVTCHPFTGGSREIAVIQTISNATGSGGVRYIEAVLYNAGNERIDAFFAYITLIQP